MSIIDILRNYHEALFGGLLTTLQLCAIIWSVGLCGGGMLGIVAHRLPRSVGVPTSTASFVMSSVPILVFLFWLHFPLAELGLRLPPFWSATLALSFVNVLAVTDIVRNTLGNFPGEYIVAGRVSGLSQSQILRHIQLPLILRDILPPLITAQVTVLQATLFASLISVDEIFRTAQTINARIYQPIEIYTALGFFFLAICGPIHGLAIILKRRFGRNLSELTPC